MFNFKFHIQSIITREVKIKTSADMQGIRKFTLNIQFLSKLFEHALKEKEALTHKQEAMRFNKQCIQIQEDSQGKYESNSHMADLESNQPANQPRQKQENA